MKSQVKVLCNGKQMAVRLSCEVTIHEEAQRRDGILRYVFSLPGKIDFSDFNCQTWPSRTLECR